MTVLTPPASKSSRPSRARKTLAFDRPANPDSVGVGVATPRLHAPDSLARRLRPEVVEIPGGTWQMFACTRAEYDADPPRLADVIWLAIDRNCVGLREVVARPSFGTVG